ncbi:nucleotidyltransferase family protein [Thioalkalivibrio sp. ALMg13-2]|uniref:nucleotidyltransferase family protein n=1 Tax=Thioalkalivibrio sp. ALMg13-2 TaxID=1158167 RepID=UPI00036A5C59|nr:nucleotidyltransferase family protein [Thioalkalivibrio sp. ALMg13-2]
MGQMSRRLDRTAVLKALKDHRAYLEREFGVCGLALFGSLARDEAGEQSDVDILVGYDGPASAQQYFGVQFYLEDLLGYPVDLVSEKALRAELRPFVEREAIRV